MPILFLRFRRAFDVWVHPTLQLLSFGLAVTLLSAGTSLLLAAQESTPQESIRQETQNQERPNPEILAVSPVDFQREIRPLLSDRCWACHGPDAKQRQADLRLDQPEGLIERSILPAIAGRSGELWERITSNEPDLQMPPSDAHQQLDNDEKELLGRWLEQGAPYTAHWSYQPLQPGLPAPADDSADLHNGIDPIDQLIHQQLERRGLSPADRADEFTLLRRVTLDLIGLPPHPADVDAYFNDPNPDRYEKWVDRLLQSPQYGERMAIFWFDLIRFADTVGYHGDQDHPIVPFRDWVIDTLNQDLGFDRFSTEQLAGDLLDSSNESSLIATGYLRVLQTSHEGGIQRGEYLAKYSADRVRNFGEVWLGTTLGCAECHDHKYDPVTQHDFYAIAAFFADIDDSGTFVGTDTLPTRREPELDVRSPLDVRRMARLSNELDRLRAELAHADAIQADELNTQRDQLEATIKSLDERRFRTMIVRHIEPRAMRLLSRGDWMDDSGPVVLPTLPTWIGAAHRLSELSTREEAARDQSTRLTRLDLAHWLFDEAAPLTSRVLANRLWARFFGTGISADLGDFGAQGTTPAAPELLDHLAASLINDHWRLKPLVRRMVLSDAYCRSTDASESLIAADETNELWGRQQRVRLDAEIIRDQALAASGLLVDEPGGVACRPYQPEGYYEPLNFPLRTYVADEGLGQYRRGVYVHWQRQFLHPMLRAFDAPTREECTAQRNLSNTPIAALAGLNDPSLVEAARYAAEREVGAEGYSTDDPESVNRAITHLFRRLLVRYPNQDEIHALQELHSGILLDYQQDRQAASQLLEIGNSKFDPTLDAAEVAAMTFVARALLNTDEALMRP